MDRDIEEMANTDFSELDEDDRETEWLKFKASVYGDKNRVQFLESREVIRWKAGVLGICLVGLAFLFSGAFMYVYLILGLKFLVDRFTSSEKNVSEMELYLLGGLFTLLMFLGSGGSIGNVPFSLLELVVSWI